MQYYEIKLNSEPEIIFACSVESHNYKNSFPNRRGLLEISVCEEGEIQCIYEDSSRRTVVPGMINIIVNDLKCTMSCIAGVLQRHTTVGIVADYEYKIIDTDDINLPEVLGNLEKNRTILIPHMVELGDDYEKVIDVIKGIAHDYTSINPCDSLYAISKWYRLAGTLTDIVIRKISGKTRNVSSSAIDYVNTAKLYVKEHHSCVISVSDVASCIGISEGYLQNIFKTVTGMSLIEYINIYKINMVKQYAKSARMTLKEASDMVGIDDPSYLSRLFKKVCGMSFREYSSE